MWQRLIWPVLSQSSNPNPNGFENKEPNAGALAADATPVLFGLESVGLSPRPPAHAEVDGIGRIPLTPDRVPPTAQRWVVVGHEINGQPIVVETAAGRRYGVRMLSAQVSLVELLLFCERAKAAGHTRVEIVVLSHRD